MGIYLKNELNTSGHGTLEPSNNKHAFIQVCSAYSLNLNKTSHVFFSLTQPTKEFEEYKVYNTNIY